MTTGNSAIDSLTVSNFRDYFSRDFANAGVSDAEVSRAMSEASASINTGLFSSDSAAVIAYHYLTAHNLVLNMQAAGGGVNSTGRNIINSESVGDVSANYSIPDAYLKNPILNGYARTDYGLKYLSMIIPRLVGNIRSVSGGARP